MNIFHWGKDKEQLNAVKGQGRKQIKEIKIIDSNEPVLLKSTSFKEKLNFKWKEKFGRLIMLETIN